MLTFLFFKLEFSNVVIYYGRYESLQISGKIYLQNYACSAKKTQGHGV